MYSYIQKKSLFVFYFFAGLVSVISLALYLINQLIKRVYFNNEFKQIDYMKSMIEFETNRKGMYLFKG